jgi:hypothetical protein
MKNDELGGVWVRVHEKVFTDFQSVNVKGRNLFGVMFVDERLTFTCS